MKACGFCGKLKKISGFHKNPSAKDGLRSYCKSCATLKMRFYRKNGSSNIGSLEEMSIAQLKRLRLEIDVTLHERGLK